MIGISNHENSAALGSRVNARAARGESFSKPGSEVGHDFDRSQGPYSRGTPLRSVSFLLRLAHLAACACTCMCVCVCIRVRSASRCDHPVCVICSSYRRDVLYRVAQKRWKSVAGTYSLTTAPRRLSLGENFNPSSAYDRADSVS